MTMKNNLIAILLALSASALAIEPVDRINPFIGTAYTGHCNPAASRPFAFVQPGPDTGTGAWEYCAGYRYEDTTIDGFSQNHVNGTGRGEMGDLLLLPFCGEKVLRKSAFSHERETASAGYYAVSLDEANVFAEMTASDHVAFHRYTFKGGRARVLVDMQHGNTCQASLVHAHVLSNRHVFAADGRTISGTTWSRKNWPAHPYSFHVEFNRPFTAKLLLPPDDPQEKGPRYVLDFDIKSDETLLVKVAMSSSDDSRKAAANMVAEIPHWDFDRVRAEARAAWSDVVSRIEVEGAGDDELAVLYTAMYRLCLQPNIISDAGERPRYSTFSLWDTFRAAHPIYTILVPERVEGFMDSILAHARRDG